MLIWERERLRVARNNQCEYLDLWLFYAQVLENFLSLFSSALVSFKSAGTITRVI